MKILTNFDFNQNEIQNVAIQRLATAPTNPTPVKGQMFFNTTSNRLYYYNGAEWVKTDAIEAKMTGDNIIDAINISAKTIDDDNLSASVNSAITAMHTTHAISDVTGLQTALDGKVDDSQVLTNVPAGAKFTDTVYTLPVAGAFLGGVKSGTDITVDASGNVAVNDDSHNHVISNVDGLQTALDALPTAAEAQGYATTAEGNANGYTDTAILNLISSAPGALDTLNELAAALGDDPNFATTVTNNLAAKTDKYTTTVGDGASTSYVITHNLNSRDIVIMLRESASPYAQVITDVEMTTVNTITLKFAVAPTAAQYTITVIG